MERRAGPGWEALVTDGVPKASHRPASHPAGDPLSGYDFGLMWEELGVGPGPTSSFRPTDTLPADPGNVGVR